MICSGFKSGDQQKKLDDRDLLNMSEVVVFGRDLLKVSEVTNFFYLSKN
jgi:hypothetical protein